MDTREVGYVGLRGNRVGFAALGVQRWCTGRIAFRKGKGSEYVACPQQRPVDVGSQCAECESKDGFRFVHTIHRGGFVSRELEAHVMQPHWLYIATFANGVHKVGTAADTRKWGRLAEQGAMCAQYVARAEDGKVIRVLEDRVTEVLQVRQAVRSSAKAAALALPIDTARLDAATGALAARVRSMIEPEDGETEYRIVDESWQAPGFRDLATGNRLAYPNDLTAGTHGFTVDACIGQTAVVTVEGNSYVVDLHELKGRRVEFGDYSTELPPVQWALF